MVCDYVKYFVKRLGCRFCLIGRVFLWKDYMVKDMYCFVVDGKIEIIEE